jgi:hypothetical protein
MLLNWLSQYTTVIGGKEDWDKGRRYRYQDAASRVWSHGFGVTDLESRIWSCASGSCFHFVTALGCIRIGVIVGVGI